jgi:hypothetical protein
MKYLLALLISFYLFTSSSAQAYAALVNVNNKGEIILNVLASEEGMDLEIPKNESLEVKEVANASVSKDAKIAIVRSDGKVKLDVISTSGNKSLDVTDYNDEVIQIENRPETEEVSIGLVGDKFKIQQKGAYAVTDFEINIDPQKAEIELSTPSGMRYLSILPRTALQTTLRLQLINKLTDGLSIVEDEGSLTYNIVGEKIINLFNVYDYAVPVTVKVSAQTAEIVGVEQPKWLAVWNFFFT